MFRSNPCILILALINVSNKMLFLTWGPRGSKVRDTGVGDPAMEVMLGVQRQDLVGPRRRPGRAQGWDLRQVRHRARWVEREVPEDPNLKRPSTISLKRRRLQPKGQVNGFNDFTPSKTRETGYFFQLLLFVPFNKLKKCSKGCFFSLGVLDLECSGPQFCGSNQSPGFTCFVTLLQPVGSRYVW